MLTCPHCQGHDLRHVFNIFMGSFGKATCHICGNDFSVTTKVRWAVQALCYFSGMCTLLAALLMHSAWPLIIYAAIVLQLFILVMFRFDLVEEKTNHLDLIKQPSDKKD
ncbi:MAG: hypothetical protein ACPGUE_17975 [Marinomonas sp.]